MFAAGALAAEFQSVMKIMAARPGFRHRAGQRHPEGRNERGRTYPRYFFSKLF